MPSSKTVWVSSRPPFTSRTNPDLLNHGRALDKLVTERQRLDRPRSDLVRDERGRRAIAVLDAASRSTLRRGAAQRHADQQLDRGIRSLLSTGLVHRGFYTNLRSIWDEIGRLLQEAVGQKAGSNGNGASFSGTPRPTAE